MQNFVSLAALLSLFIALVSARSPHHVRRKMREPPGRREELKQREPHESREDLARGGPRLEERVSKYMNINSSKFSVDGTAIPEVNFDIGESYAGLLPISNNPNETRELFFWFFPSTNPDAENEITIWLNGGPGCSSLEGLLQENGPFLWQYGTFAPVRNPYTWVNLTNMVWVEQPVGTGFSQGTPNAQNEVDVAKQFLGFFKNFVETFRLQGKKVYIAGESYAGSYIPYIADAMFDANDTTHFNIESIMMYDPAISTDTVQELVPAVAYLNYWQNLLALNDTFMSFINARSESCGYSSFLETYLKFPPDGPMPIPPEPKDGGGCFVWDEIYNAATSVNPCFNIYDITTTCPNLWDVLGDPGSYNYLPAGAQIYYDRPDVQQAIHAPPTKWRECADRDVFLNGTDTSPPTALSDVLPRVIERTNKTIIGQGGLDFIIITNGTLLAIQNMTWAGTQGFSKPPTNDFFVPYHRDYSLSNVAGAGVFGKWVTERGLTFVTVDLSGHMIPQYAPTASYRQLEFLLGRIDNLSVQSDFTTQTGGFGN